MEIGQISPSYVWHLTQLNKLLVQRNSLLKQMAQKQMKSSPLLDVLDEQLIELSVQLWTKRLQFLKLLTRWAKEIHGAITAGKEDLEIRYISSLNLPEEAGAEEWGEAMRRLLPAWREREMTRGSTLIGPHRDDLSLAVGGVDLHAFGSQGQQRTAALSLKLAEIELIHQETGHFPILLLDDVLSELDDVRKTHLLEAIRGRVQTFVTTTNLEGIDSRTLERAIIYQVRQGMITKLG
jgi:DNA replication and repair protein RecF